MCDKSPCERNERFEEEARAAEKVVRAKRLAQIEAAEAEIEILRRKVEALKTPPSESNPLEN